MSCEAAQHAASQIQSQLPTIATSTVAAQPKDLAAATAAAQEKGDRHAAGDFAGEWMMFTKDLRGHITQQAFVEFSKACDKTGVKLKAAGGRMDGADRAIIRYEVLGFTDSVTMVYEDGGWYKVPSDFLTANYGKTGAQLIAAERAEGKCATG